MREKNIDYNLLIAVLFLMVFGMIMISSVSVYSSYRVTNAMVLRGEIVDAYNYFYVLRNIGHVLSSLLLMFFVTKINYSFFEKYSKRIFSVNIFLLIFVLVQANAMKGATRWIDLPGLPSIQPSEFLKVGLIIFLAAFFKKYYGYLGDLKKGFLPFLGILASLVVLIGLQPDFGTLIVVIPVSVIMYFYAGMNIKHLLITIFLGAFLALSVYGIGNYDKETGQNLNKLGYVTQRVDNFLADNKDAIKNNTINDQTKQALVTIGSGGFWGKGFGGSIQKFGYLPEVQGDFIFSVIIEELGFFGGFGLLLVYMFIGYRCLYIANRVKDKFGKFVAVGVGTRILTQAFVNIGVNLNIIPLTGLTLPFVSYGGSSLLSLMVGLGILLSISRETDESNIEEKRKSKVMFI